MLINRNGFSEECFISWRLVRRRNNILEYQEDRVEDTKKPRHPNAIILQIPAETAATQLPLEPDFGI